MPPFARTFDKLHAASQFEIGRCNAPLYFGAI